MFVSSRTFLDNFLRIKIYCSLVFHGVGLDDSLLRASLRIVSTPKLKTGFEEGGSQEGSRDVNRVHVNILQSTLLTSWLN